MTILVLGLVLFLGVHSLLIVKPDLRAGIIARGGAGVWTLPYVGTSVLGLGLIIVGYGLARQNAAVVYSPPNATRHLALLLMLPVFPLLLAAYMPGRIKSALRHPMLIATVLWGAAHLVANGSIADVLLFGGFAVWAIADMVSLTHRPAKSVPALPGRPFNDAVAIVGGLILYLAFVGGLHRWLIGVSPI